jgi:tetratricopeptide (TPR) repeat protein
MTRGAAALVFCAGVALAAPPLAAGDDGGTMSPFSLGAGCRGIAMGGAASAVWGDSYVLFWNPAGLCGIERLEASLFHTSLFDDATTYSAAALSHPFLGIGVFSFGAIQLRAGGIEQRDASNMLLDGELNNVQTRYALGCAREIVHGFSAGLDLKLDRFMQGSYGANGFGLDLGVGLETEVHSPAMDGIALGFSIMNAIEPTMKLAEREAGDPRGVRAGLAMWRSVSGGSRDRLIVAVDAERTRLSPTRLHCGAEYRIKGVFAVRGGWSAGIPTFGCGLVARGLLLDYAYRSTDLGGNHLFSLALRLGASQSEEREQAKRRHDEEIRKELETQVASYENRSVTAALDEGRAALANKDYAGALDRFRRVLLWSPSNEQAQDGQRRAAAALALAGGDSLAAKGRYAEALYSYREAQKTFPSDEASDRIWRYELRVRELSNAEQTREETLARAIDLYANRNWAEAASGFKEVLALDPKHELALDYLSRARAKIQEQYERMFVEADRLAASGRFAAAVQPLAIELEKNPTDVRIEAKIAEIAALRKKAESAQAKVEAEKSRGETISAEDRERLRPAYDRGIDCFTRADFARAIAEWEGVYHVFPAYERVSDYLVKAYQYLGMEYYAHHDYDRALEVWNKILVIDPNNEKAIRYISKTKEELSKLEGLTGR